mgnify:CR=1 FL=1
MFQEEINDAVEVAAEEVVEKEYVDETLVCKDCGNEFVFTAGEQRFYDEKGFLNKPKACKACRDAKKNAQREPREYFTVVCSAQIAAARQRSPSNLLPTVLFTAALASRQEERLRTNPQSHCLYRFLVL